VAQRLHARPGRGRPLRTRGHAAPAHGAGDRVGDLDPVHPARDLRPRAEIDALCDEVIRSQLETSDLDTLRSGVREGDIVFFDGSHRLFQNSDVAVFFCELLPSLPARTLVGIHDIYLPDDYPAELVDRMYSEQYVLAAYLLGAAARRPVHLPLHFISTRRARFPAAAALVAGLPAGTESHGCALWIETPA
jgi:hypothetical protein